MQSSQYTFLLPPSYNSLKKKMQDYYRSWNSRLSLPRSACTIPRHVRLGEILPVSGPRSEAGAYAKSRASVNERKHIKDDGALLKEGREKRETGGSKQLFFLRVAWASGFRVLCVHILEWITRLARTERSLRPPLLVLPKLFTLHESTACRLAF